MQEEYYKLPTQKRWLPDGNNPNCIGGRDTDVTQIGYRLQDIVLQKYPDACSFLEAKSEVSRALAIRLDTLFNVLNEAELAIADVIYIVSQAVINE